MVVVVGGGGGRAWRVCVCACVRVCVRASERVGSVIIFYKIVCVIFIKSSQIISFTKLYLKYLANASRVKIQKSRARWLGL